LRQRPLNSVGAWAATATTEYTSPPLIPQRSEPADHDARRGRNKLDVCGEYLRVAFHGEPLRYPPQLVETPIKAGCPPGHRPFAGLATLLVQEAGTLPGHRSNPALRAARGKRLTG